MTLSRIVATPPSPAVRDAHVALMEAVATLCSSAALSQFVPAAAYDDDGDGRARYRDTLAARLVVSREIMSYVAATAMGAPAGGASSLQPSRRTQLAAAKLLRVVLVAVPETHRAAVLSAGVSAAGGIGGLMRVLRAPGTAEATQEYGAGPGSDDFQAADAMMLLGLVANAARARGAAPVTVLADALTVAMKPVSASALDSRAYSTAAATAPGVGGGASPLPEAFRYHLLSRNANAVLYAAELTFTICSSLPESIGVRGCLASDIAEYLYEALRGEEQRSEDIVQAVINALCALGKGAASAASAAAERDSRSYGGGAGSTSDGAELGGGSDCRSSSAHLFAWHSRSGVDVVCSVLARRGRGIGKLLCDGATSQDVRVLIGLLHLAAAQARAGAASQFSTSARVLRAAVGIIELVGVAHVVRSCGGGSAELVDTAAAVSHERLLAVTSGRWRGAIPPGLVRADQRTGVIVVAACGEVMSALIGLVNAIAGAAPKELDAEVVRSLMIAAGVGIDTVVAMSSCIEGAGAKGGTAAESAALRASALWRDIYVALEAALRLCPEAASATAVAPGGTGAAVTVADHDMELHAVRDTLTAQIFRALAGPGGELDASAIAGSWDATVAWASLAGQWNALTGSRTGPGTAEAVDTISAPSRILPRSALLIALAISDATVAATGVEDSHYSESDGDGGGGGGGEFVDSDNDVMRGVAHRVAAIVKTAATAAGLLSSGMAAKWETSGVLTRLPRDARAAMDALVATLSARSYEDGAAAAAAASDIEDAAVHVCMYATILQLVLPTGAELPALLSEVIFDARTQLQVGDAQRDSGDRPRGGPGPGTTFAPLDVVEQSTLTHDERVALLLLYCHIYNVDSSGCAAPPEPPHAHVCAAVTALIGRGNSNAVALAAVQHDKNAALLMLWEASACAAASDGPWCATERTAAAVVRAVSLDCMSTMGYQGKKRNPAAAQDLVRAIRDTFTDLIRRGHLTFLDWILELLTGSSDSAILLSTLGLLLHGCSSSTDDGYEHAMQPPDTVFVRDVPAAAAAAIARRPASVRDAIVTAVSPSSRGAAALEKLLAVLLPPFAVGAADRHLAPFMKQFGDDEGRLRMTRDALALRNRGIAEGAGVSVDKMATYMCRGASVDIVRRAAALVKYVAESGGIGSGSSQLMQTMLMNEVLIECLNTGTVSFIFAAAADMDPFGPGQGLALSDSAAARFAEPPVWVAETALAVRAALESDAYIGNDSVPHTLTAAALAAHTAALLYSNSAATGAASLSRAAAACVTNVLCCLSAPSPIVREAAFLLTAVYFGSHDATAADRGCRTDDAAADAPPPRVLDTTVTTPGPGPESDHGDVLDVAPYVATCAQNTLVEAMMLCVGADAPLPHGTHSLDVAAIAALTSLMVLTGTGGFASNPAVARIFEAPTWEVLADQAAIRITGFASSTAESQNACHAGVDVACLILSFTAPLRDRRWPRISAETAAALNTLCTSHSRRHGLSGAVSLAVLRAQEHVMTAPGAAAAGAETAAAEDAATGPGAPPSDSPRFGRVDKYLTKLLPRVSTKRSSRAAAAAKAVCGGPQF